MKIGGRAVIYRLEDIEAFERASIRPAVAMAVRSEVAADIAQITLLGDSRRITHPSAS